MEQDNRFSIRKIIDEYSAVLRKLNELQAISGMTIDELIKKFEAGWTMREPDPALKLSKELNELTSGLYKCLQEKGAIE